MTRKRTPKGYLGPNRRPPYPGSHEAVAVGCLCDKDQNVELPIIRADCPLHGVIEARRDVQMEI